MIKISFVSITLNNKDGFIKTIKSYQSFKVLYPNCEIIVIDGLSKDGTDKVSEEYKALINIYKSEKDDGIYDAMNKGLELVTGQYVCFMNAGDQILPEGMHELIKCITDSTVCYVGKVTWDSKLLNFKYLEFYPKLLRFPIHQAMLIPINLCFKFNLSYKVASDIDQKIKIVKSKKIKIFDIPVALCESNGVSQQLTSVKMIFYRSIELFQIAYDHYGLFIGLLNLAKFNIWHIYNYIRKYSI